MDPLWSWRTPDPERAQRGGESRGGYENPQAVRPCRFDSGPGHHRCACVHLRHLSPMHDGGTAQVEHRTAYILSDEIRYRHGKSTHLLKAGDSLTFRGDVAHGPERLVTVLIRMLSIII
jgi:uncharacterized cupin superfamily protein